MATLSTEFIACGCNTGPHMLDWNHSLNIIAFASSSNVCITVPEDEGCAAYIKATYSKHKADITALCWLRRLSANGGEAHSDHLVTGAADGSAYLWTHMPDLGLKVCAELLPGTSKCSSPISATAGCQLEDGSSIVVCLPGDCVFRLDGAESGTPDIKRVPFRTQLGDTRVDKTADVSSITSSFVDFAQCVDIAVLSNKEVCLVIGCLENIHLYAEIDGKFELLQLLSGHANWVRDLRFHTDVASGDVLLASCAQDCFVRIWRIKKLTDALVNGVNSASSSSSLLPEASVDLQSGRLSQLVVRGRRFKLKDYEFDVVLDAILQGHEGWVYSVRWRSSPKGEVPLELMFASVDKSIILWQPDAESGVWLDKVRVGDVGGNSFGFYGGVYGPADQVLGHSYHGGLQMWALDVESGAWVTAVVPSGHFGAVEDICWDPKGLFLISCSSDQTTRLFAPWIREGKKTTIHETARPQVHGHDLPCLSCITSGLFVSGAEEKILRVFAVTKHFVDNFTLAYNSRISSERVFGDVCNAAEGASVPALGLSNRAVAESSCHEVANDSKDGYSTNFADFHGSKANGVPPTEDHLMQDTLWPEVTKLYGHGFEIFVVASNHAGTIIASACKATKLDHAALILWRVSDWHLLCRLEAHTLTVTRIAFSPNDRFLLSVSRDRTWALFERSLSSPTEEKWVKVAQTDKKTCIHGRIIWDCAWTSDSRFFVTVSRDKKAVFWKVTFVADSNSFQSFMPVGSPLELPESVTAVAVSPVSFCNNAHVIAFGLENGWILIYRWSEESGFTLLLQMDNSQAHSAPVKRLRFRPVLGRISVPVSSQTDEQKFLQLASASDDHSVKIFSLDLSRLSLS